MSSTDRRFKDAAGDIWQHMVNNNDWTYQYLLTDRLDLLGSEDSVFLRFLEACLHPLAVRDEQEARDLADRFNSYLEKDGYKLVVSERISGHPMFAAVDLETARKVAEPRDIYEVVLSFAGEERQYVEHVADYLVARGVRCFYDRYEEHTLWGKELVEHLQRVYRSARYCVMFISESYATKVWPNHERRSALERAIREKAEYILPARFDATEIPGLSSTIGYIDLSSKSPEQVAELIMRKLGRTGITGV
jgi:hypothetical protein